MIDRLITSLPSSRPLIYPTNSGEHPKIVDKLQESSELAEFVCVMVAGHVAISVVSTENSFLKSLEGLKCQLIIHIICQYSVLIWL